MKSLLLIDLSGVWHANWHATADLEIGEAYSRTIAKVESLRSGYDLVAICEDVGPYNRKALSPRYKAQRDAPAANMLAQFDRVKARLEADGLLRWGVKGYEADDIIATAVRHATAAGLDVTIASSDKDLLQLVSDERGVSVMSTSDGKIYHREQVIAKFGVAPEDVGDLLALMGDKSDNIPGAPGIGPKKGAALLAEFGSLAGIFENADQLKGAVQESILASGDAVRLARKLVALDDQAPIRFEDVFAERAATPLNNPEEYEDMDSPDDMNDSAPNAAPSATESPIPISGPPTATPEPGAVIDAEMFDPEPAALARVAPEIPAEWERAFEPTSLGTAYKLAKAIYASKMYPKLPNAQAILVVMMRGRGLGMTAAQALDVIQYFEGKTALPCHLIVEMTRQSQDCEYFRYIGGDDTYAEYETKRRGNPEVRLKYTIEQAKQAGLCPDVIRTRRPAEGKDPRGMWEKVPNQMLRKTCAVQLARIEYPGPTLGLVGLEEMGAE